MIVVIGGIKGGTGNELEIFKVTYKTPLVAGLRKELENNDALQTSLIIIGIILSTFGIIDIYKGIINFIRKLKNWKTHKPNFYLYWTPLFLLYLFLDLL